MKEAWWGLKAKGGIPNQLAIFIRTPLVDDVKGKNPCHVPTCSATAMAGPNLEVFKFGLYVFFPVLMLLKYGDSEWYQKNVIPVSALDVLQKIAA